MDSFEKLQEFKGESMVRSRVKLFILILIALAAMATITIIAVVFPFNGLHEILMGFFVINSICYGGAMGLCAYHMQKQIKTRQVIALLERRDNDPEEQDFDINARTRSLLEQLDRHKASLRQSTKYFFVFWVPLMWCMILMIVIKNKILQI